MPRTGRAIRAESRPRLSAEEMEMRRDLVIEAHHSNLLEGIEPDSEMDHIFEAFIRGEIDVQDLVPRIRAVQTSR